MFPSPHIVAAVGLPLLCVLCFALGRLTRPARRGLYLRRGGYIAFSPGVSGNENPGTGRAHRTSTGCKPDGPWRVGRGAQGMPHYLSKTIAPTGSGSVTVTHPGGRTTGATGPSDAG